MTEPERPAPTEEPLRSGDPATEDHGSHRGVPTGSVMYVVYVCALAASVLGLYFGFHYDRPVVDMAYPERPAPLSARIPEGAVPATAYADISGSSFGANPGYRTRLERQRRPILTQEPVVPGDAETKRASLAARAGRRAYNGAPPTIPHTIDPRSAASCVACHGPDGMQLGTVTAKPMPHAHYASCTQCHVPQRPIAPDEERWLDNAFAGLEAPTEGHRAYPGAPPVIPHSVHMRENCATCHGWSGAPGLESSHPWRTSCTQCHAPWASRNMQPGADSEAPFFLPGPAVEESSR